MLKVCSGPTECPAASLGRCFERLRKGCLAELLEDKLRRQGEKPVGPEEMRFFAKVDEAGLAGFPLCSKTNLLKYFSRLKIDQCRPRNSFGWLEMPR